MKQIVEQNKSSDWYRLTKRELQAKRNVTRNNDQNETSSETSKRNAGETERAAQPILARNETSDWLCLTKRHLQAKRNIGAKRNVRFKRNQISTEGSSETKCKRNQTSRETTTETERRAKLQCETHRRNETWGETKLSGKGNVRQNKTSSKEIGARNETSTLRETKHRAIERSKMSSETKHHEKQRPKRNVERNVKTQAKQNVQRNETSDETKAPPKRNVRRNTGSSKTHARVKRNVNFKWNETSSDPAKRNVKAKRQATQNVQRYKTLGERTGGTKRRAKPNLKENKASR